MNQNCKYSVYSVEMGYDKESPFHNTSDRDEAEIVARDLAYNNLVVVYVFSEGRQMDYYCVNPFWKDKTNVNEV